ncbi:unnamed protein product, partial [Oppiella nova]
MGYVQNNILNQDDTNYLNYGGNRNRYHQPRGRWFRTNNNYGSNNLGYAQGYDGYGNDGYQGGYQG